MRGLVAEGRPDFKLDKAGGYDSPNTALCLVREGDITRRACLSRKIFVAEISFPAKGTWSCLRADLIYLEILSRRIGLLGEIAHQDRPRAAELGAQCNPTAAPEQARRS